jgi:SAM-dependent methyltransferase
VTVDNPFEHVADLYDWEHDGFTEDLEVYVALARRFGAPVLELACGTGRILEALTSAGLDVTGVDSSPAMLARARARLGTQARLVEASIEDLHLEQHFRTIILGLDSFGLLLSRGDQLAGLSAARAHATHDARLVLDVSNGNLRGGGEPVEEVLHQLTAPDPGSGLPITKWAVRRPNPAEQLDEMTLFYDQTDASGCVRRTTVDMRLRWFTRFELELLLERSGWALDELYGSYQLERYGPSSDRLFVVARPAGP